MKLHNIKRELDERYETLYQRIIAHLEDNLLTSEAGLIHDGEAIATDKEMTPTVERLAVYLWLVLIDQRLPAFISRIYAHDLQTKSLKEIQPQICEAIDLLLIEMAAQDDIQVNFSRTSYNQRKNFNNKRRLDYKPTKVLSQKQKQCILCKNCW